MRLVLAVMVVVMGLNQGCTCQREKKEGGEGSQGAPAEMKIEQPQGNTMPADEEEQYEEDGGPAEMGMPEDGNNPGGPEGAIEEEEP